MQLDGFFDSVVKFKLFEGKSVVGSILKDPTRLVTGVDPASTRVWNAATGSDNKALVDQWGGTTRDTALAAKRAGIDIRPGMALEAVAHMVASYYAGAGLAKAMPQGDTLLTIAKNLKSVADRQGGVGPSYPTPGYYQGAPMVYPDASGYAPGEYAAQSVSHAKQLPDWVVPAGIGAAVLLIVIAATAPRR
jgi:hypothetical protein